MFANGAATAAMAYAFNQLAHHERAQTEEEAIDSGIENSRSLRGKANDYTRRDHPNASYSELRGQRFGGVVLQETRGMLWWSEELYFAPREFDFLLGSSGFNFRHGDGLRMSGFMGGSMDEGNVRALIVNIPGDRDFSATFGSSASYRFGGAPVYVVQGTSQNVRRYQINMGTNKMSCSKYPGGGSC